jgi:hypothetical protein
VLHLVSVDECTVCRIRERILVTTTLGGTDEDFGGRMRLPRRGACGVDGAQLGHDVVGIDVDVPKVEALQLGKAPSSSPVSTTC